MLALVLAPMLAMASPPAQSCALPQTTHTSHDAPHVTVQKLGELPDADLDLAVMRTVDGCSMRQVVRFHVSSPGPGGPEAGLQLPGIKGTLVPQGMGNPAPQPVR